MALEGFSVFNYFMPIFSFLLVFLVVYILIKKTEVWGTNNSVAIFISLVLASLFVVESSLVEKANFGSDLFGVITVAIFFLMIVLAFFPGKEALAFLSDRGWTSWVSLGLIIGLFIISASYVFNWLFSWLILIKLFNTEWFGMILLFIVAAVISWNVTRRKFN